MRTDAAVFPLLPSMALVHQILVVRRTSAVEIDEFFQKQLRLEGAVLPLAPIVAEPGGEPAFRPLLDLVALGREIVRQVQEQVRVPTMV